MEKIYSIRTISQYSQLLLQVEQSRKTKENQGARCGTSVKHHARRWFEAIQTGNW